MVTVTRLTSAAVIAYLITLVVTEGAIDLTGPLTALLVVQASAYSTLKMGAVRVGAVLSGVLVATLLSTWVGLTWWSLGAAIAASLVLGKVLRLEVGVAQQPPDDGGADRPGTARDQDAAHATASEMLDRVAAG